jgi:CheY-like chemotaxis protein
MNITTSPEKLFAGCTVLVVDDNPNNLVIVGRILAKHGAEILTASDGREGLAVARRYRPSFIIADLQMPDMNGWDMLTALKKERTTLDIPIVALTASPIDGDRNRAIGNGFHNYLLKPIMPDTFIPDLVWLLKDDLPQLSSRVI